MPIKGGKLVNNQVENYMQKLCIKNVDKNENVNKYFNIFGFTIFKQARCEFSYFYKQYFSTIINQVSNLKVASFTLFPHRTTITTTISIRKKN